MFDRIKNSAAGFWNNIQEATHYRHRGSAWQISLHWACVCVGIMLALASLLVFLVFLVNWPVFTMGLVLGAAIARIIYAGVRGR
jgi:hypothetical protein